MNQMIWYCTEDGTIYPNEHEARKGYAEFCKENAEDFDEEIFTLCYQPISFADYNEQVKE